MTLKQVFESALTELNKVNAPSLLLSEFNYYLNKALNLYINKRYNIYDMNQLTTDDLRVLKATSFLKPTRAYLDLNKESTSQLSALVPSLTNLYGATYEVELPSDYYHLLNCICVYKVKRNKGCYTADSYIQKAAKRLTSDSWSTIMDDYYNRPTAERPYYFIHNYNKNVDIPTNPIQPNSLGKLWEGTDMVGHYGVDNLDDFRNFQHKLSLANDENSEDETSSNVKIDMIERESAQRYGNASPVRMEIRYGKDTTVFELVQVLVDYLKVPQFLLLTQELMDLDVDVSQIMEFPDYVCQEIINELVTILMARTADPGLQAHIAVSLSIASPVQQLTNPAAPAANL